MNVNSHAPKGKKGPEQAYSVLYLGWIRIALRLSPLCMGCIRVVSGLYLDWMQGVSGLYLGCQCQDAAINGRHRQFPCLFTLYTPSGTPNVFVRVTCCHGFQVNQMELYLCQLHCPSWMKVRGGWSKANCLMSNPSLKCCTPWSVDGAVSVAPGSLTHLRELAYCYTRKRMQPRYHLHVRQMLVKHRRGLDVTQM